MKAQPCLTVLAFAFLAAASCLARAVHAAETSGDSYEAHRAYLALRKQGKYRQALPLFTEALALRRKLLGEEHPHVAACLHGLAGLGMRMGRLEEAWAWAEEARTILLRARGRAASPLARAAFLGDRAVSGLAVSLALKLAKDADFVELLEQERALGLRELLAQARAQSAAGCIFQKQSFLRSFLSRGR